METPDEILNFYLQLIKSDNLHELSDHLASNAILDWFGRTFKSPRLICDHFRYLLITIKHVTNLTFFK